MSKELVEYGAKLVTSEVKMSKENIRVLIKVMFSEASEEDIDDIMEGVNLVLEDHYVKQD